MTDKEIKNEIHFKRALAESYRQIAGNTTNNPEQFYRACEQIKNEASSLQKMLGISKELR